MAECPDTDDVQDLIERSSLGTPGAKQLRARTPPAVVERILARSRQAADVAESAPSPTSTAPRPPAVIYDEATAIARRASRNIAAEARGVEEGHTCRWDAQRRLFLVHSEGGTRNYELTVGAGAGGLLVVSCTCPAGVKRRQVPAGQLVCKHAGRVAHRLDAEGLARFDGVRWLVSEEAKRLGDAR